MWARFDDLECPKCKKSTSHYMSDIRDDETWCDHCGQKLQVFVDVEISELEDDD